MGRASEVAGQDELSRAGEARLEAWGAPGAAHHLVAIEMELVSAGALTTERREAA